MTAIYVFFLSAGLFFALVSAFLSGVFGGDHGGVDGGHGGDVSGGHGDIGGAHGEAGALGGDAAAVGAEGIDPVAGGDHHAGAGSHEVHMSPLSPTILCLVAAGFGASGLIVDSLLPDINRGIGVPVALAGGLAAGALGFFVFGKILSLGAGTSAPRQRELVGVVAEVITTIPVDGVGEIAYTVRGARYTAPARSLDTLEVKRRSQVVIDRISGNVFVVKPVQSVQKGV